jgi:hypothetical protein
MFYFLPVHGSKGRSHAAYAGVGACVSVRLAQSFVPFTTHFTLAVALSLSRSLLDGSSDDAAKPHCSHSTWSNVDDDDCNEIIECLSEENWEIVKKCVLAPGATHSLSSVELLISDCV